MAKETNPKHHRICMKCKAQSTGKSVNECEKSFPRCGLTGGVPTNTCNTTMYQDGEKIFELIKVVDLTKLQDESNSQQQRIKKLENDLKASQTTGTTVSAAETQTASTIDEKPKSNPKKQSPKNSKKQDNSKSPTN